MTIASCPRCREQVSVPEGAGREAQVRCPLCREEYALSEALNRLPPALIVLGSAGAREPVASYAAREASFAEHEHALGEVRDDFHDDDLDIGPPVKSEPDFEDDAAHDHFEDDAAHDLDAAHDRRAPESPAFSPAPAFPFEPASISAQADTPMVTGRARRKRRQAGPIMTMIQVIGGGALGLIMAQLILWYMPGNWSNNNRDPLGLAKTVVKFAPFAVPEQLKNPPTDVAANTNPPAPGKSAEKPKKKKSPFELTSPNLDPSITDTLPDSGHSENVATDQHLKSEPDAGMEKGTDKDTSTASSELTSESDKSPPANVDAPRSAEKTGDKEITENGVDAGTTKTASAEIPTNDPFNLEPTLVEVPKSAPADAKPTAAATPALRDVTQATSNAITLQLAEINIAETTWDSSEKTNREEMLRLLGELYAAVAQLGRSLISVDRSDPKTAEVLSQVDQKLKAISEQPEKVKLLANYAAIWLDKERSHNGAVLVGTVVSHQPRGDVFAMRIKLSARASREIDVICPTNLAEALPANSRVMLWGTIVADPSQAIIGYQGESAPVVYNAYHFALPSE